VNAEEVAKPFAFVVSVSVAVPVDANVPLAPVAGAVNVTARPLAPDPAVTTATSGAANAAPTATLCPDPLPTAIVSAGGLELLQPVRKTAKVMKTKVRMLA
jgi:hypothetical protein